jgi:hypothetical protein
VLDTDCTTQLVNTKPDGAKPSAVGANPSAIDANPAEDPEDPSQPTTTNAEQAAFVGIHS